MKAVRNAKWILMTFLILLHTLTGETKMETIRKRLTDYDHYWMTFAAVEALSEEEREFLEPELELLITQYCTLPDLNWNMLGEWGGWTGRPEAGRSPDTRRAWNVSHYMGYDPVMEKGRRYLHASPDLYDAAGIYFRKALDSFRNGKHRDGVILLGILAHYLEDESTFGHMQALHRGHGFPFSMINTRGYEPKMLGRNLNSAVTAMEKRAREITAFVNERSILIRQAKRDGDTEYFQKLHLECNNEGARATADMLRTAIHLAKDSTYEKSARFGVNLIPNPSLEDDDGSGIPDKWFIGWYDLKDRAGGAAWERKFNRNVRNWHTGRGSVHIMMAPGKGIEWRMRWPDAIYVNPGERYYLTGWMKTHKATGNSYISLDCYRRNNTLVQSLKAISLDGTDDWKKVRTEITIPHEAEKAVVTCRSENNQGIVWFDDLELVRLKPEEPAKPQGIVGRDNLALYLPFEEKGYTVADKSNYGDILNGPIITCSGKELADLHVKGIRGNCLKFDGKDDFMELPLSRIQDPLAAEKEITVSVWVYVDGRQNAFLLSKETASGGYRIELNEDGRLQFLLPAGKEPAVNASMNYPLKKWFHLACTVRQGEKIRLYKNSMLAAESEDVVTSIDAREADFYLGADKGIEQFFRGKLDELKIYNRLLETSEIAGLQ